VKSTCLRRSSVFLTLLSALFLIVFSSLSWAESAGQLELNPLSVTFGTVAVGKTATRQETLTNSGRSNLTITKLGITGPGFSSLGWTLPLTLAPGQSKAGTLAFTPGSTGVKAGSLTISWTSKNHSYVSNVSLSGTAVASGQLTSNPTSLNFGSVQPGSKKTLSETLSNSGAAALTISQIVPSGAGFSFSGITLPVTLSPGQSFTFSVTFAPLSSSTGTINGALSISSNAANSSVSIPLSGSTVTPGQLAVSPASINFGNVTVGSSQKQTATLSASNGSVTVSSASITGTEFSVSGISFPLTIASGQSAPFSVTFAPKASGTTSATLAFASNALNGSVAESFGGTGIPSAQHSVTLNWNASSSSSVVGYNIYRSGQSAGPYVKINSALDPSTTEVDSNVLSGSTYYYVVTAVNSSGGESGYSNQVKAVVP
jgi:hypothetical protein